MNLKKEDIIFEDEIMIEGEEINAYLCENNKLDEIAGLNSKYDYNNGEYIGHNDNWNVNYYPTYNYVSKDFYIDVSITLYCSEEELIKNYPDISNIILNYYLNNRYSYTSIQNISEEDLSLIFKEFKNYCIMDCKETYGCNNFKDLILCIKDDVA